MNFLSFRLTDSHAHRSASKNLLLITALSLRISTYGVIHDYISSVPAQSSLVHIKIVLLISLRCNLLSGLTKALNAKPEELRWFILITLLALLFLQIDSWRYLISTIYRLVSGQSLFHSLKRQLIPQVNLFLVPA